MNLKKVNFKGVGCRDSGADLYSENRKLPSYLYWYNIGTLDNGSIIILA